jgi:hypothetical protein
MDWMKYHYRTIAACAMLLCCFAFGSASTCAQDSTDTRFKSKQAGFAIEFPGTPSAKSFSTPSKNGEIKLTTYSFETVDQTGFVVSFSEFPDNYMLVNNPHKLLAHSRRSAVESLGIQKFEIDETAELAGYPGVHFKGTSGFYFAIFKIYVVDGNQYQIAMLRTKSYPSDEDIASFFGSFELLVNESNIKLTNARGLPGANNEVEPFMAPDGSFRVLFPRSPLQDTSIVKADVGNVELHRFRVDRGNEALTIAYSEFPKALVELSDPKELLVAGKNSTMSSLGLTTIEEESTIELSGFPGTYFRGHSDRYYTVYRAYMVRNRLYQVAITRAGQYPNEDEVKQFMESFQLN